MRFLNSPRPIRSVLVANRGEIAVRVMRTCRRLGLRTIAVYSDADEHAIHVRAADEAIRIGPAPARSSYLDMAAVLAAAERSGADAIHPGYGFLSENAAFARRCAEAGLIFVGPSADAVERMGSKIESKRIAEAAGVPVVPGYHGADQDPASLLRAAQRIGFPVLIKASAGGGGRGMRRVDRAEEFEEALAGAKAEALSAFGDQSVLLEKFVLNPRHLEVQLAGDRLGGLVHLFERDCSVQRNNQKVLEEAPAPNLPDAVRRKLFAAALSLGRAIGYDSAGTIEFIMEQGSDSPYFLEMNTRLQVEHPVTEAITGIDLVEQMIRVAAGEKLPFTQDDIGINGWAIENRVYAEDPYRGFLPSIGRLVRYNPPESVGTPYKTPPFVPSPSAGWQASRSGQASAQSAEIEGRAASKSAGVSTSLDTNGLEEGADAGGAYTRVDDGVREGGEVSIFYDPMIAKLVTWGPTRDAAIDAQIAALDAFEISGPGHNIDFLSAIMQHSRFREGRLTTGFIAEEYPDGFHGASASPELVRALAAVAAFVATAEADRARRIDGQLGERLRPPADWAVRIAGVDHEIELAEDEISVDGTLLDMELAYTPGDRLIEATLYDGDDAEIVADRLIVRIAKAPSGFVLTTRGASHRVRVLPAHAAPYARHLIEKVPPDLSRFLLCPMPGLLMRLDVGEGDKVEIGQPLAVVEAMKMENILRAEKAGMVKAVNAKPGDSLAVDAVILEID